VLCQERRYALQTLFLLFTEGLKTLSDGTKLSEFFWGVFGMQLVQIFPAEKFSWSCCSQSSCHGVYRERTPDR